jgi:hypothetical protein
MRAQYLIPIALAVAVNTLPAYGAPFWQKHSAPPLSAQQVSQPRPGTNTLISQNSGVNSGGAVPQPGGRGIQLHLLGPGPHKGDWLRQYYTLPPNQQEQKLQQDPAFRSLSTDKQQHLLDRLRKFNSLSPDKQAKILNRMELFEHLPPEKQTEAKNLFQQYQSLPSDQKGQVSQAYHKMRQMSPEQRTQYMNSDEFRNSLNDEQRELVRGMADVNMGPVR